ncbi:AMP-binding protein [Burkholderia sp. Ac-20379]|uniref:AMP-binding protein n=1 Tax=Burkholderia sp. Ac-20379 TaxID=2703900 RepID=UPI00198250DA|nr:AMP-binding protein [Burkholderia sp. Ac-20379]MBN3723239.1 AMP-binding protein [Burkholderia sp. Ac-20379]
MTPVQNPLSDAFGLAHEPSSLIETLASHAERSPDRTALTILRDGEAIEREFSFGELYDATLRVAAGLSVLTAPGERVLLLLPSGAEFACTFYACLASGRVAVPAYHPQQARKLSQWQKLQAIVESCGARAIVAPAGSMATLDSLREAQGMFTGCAFLTYEQMVEAAVRHPEPFVPRCADPAFLQFTSGSTGTPKGVMITHASILDNQRSIAAMMGHDTATRMLSWLPLYHDMGLSLLLQLASVGVSVVLMSPVAFIQQPGRWLRAISAHRATTSGAPNFAYQLAAAALADSAPDEPLDLTSWSVAFCGAEPIQRETVSTFIEAASRFGFDAAAFYPCYGMAEATLLVTGVGRGAGPSFLDVDGARLAAGVIEPAHDALAPAKSLVSCGVPAPGTEIRIVGRDARPVAHASHVGEIWIRGGAIGAGYYGREEATLETFGARLAGQTDDTAADARAFMRSGDLGALVDGRLYVTGRLKDMLVIRGRNVYPQDIELCVQDAVPALRRGGGAAVGVMIGGEERLVIIQEVGRTARRTMDVDATLRAMSIAVGDDFGVTPHAIVLVEPATIEKTSSGKIARSLCRRAYLQGELRAVASWTEQDGLVGASEPEPAVVTAPATPAQLLVRELEARIVRTAATHLKIPDAQVPRTAPWVAMGFDSMTALQFALKVQQAVGLSFEAAVLWDCSNVAELAAHLATLPGAQAVLAGAGSGSPAAAGLPALEPHAGAEPAAPLASLSDDEAQALLLKELQR